MDINGTRPHTPPAQQDSPRMRHPIAFLVLTIVFILLSFGSILASAVVIKTTIVDTAQVSMPDTKKYQAVFMTNGQVYFGKLASVSSKYQTLNDVYYLQVQQPVQPAQAKTTPTSQISLTKLGSELHGPTDKMNISSDQILFWEDLKSDSAVVKAIEQYKAKE